MTGLHRTPVLRTPVLRGRRSECEELDGLLESVRANQSRVLVVRGEAGVGKTALLDYLVASASKCRIARAAGIESEMELAFAGVHQLCAPMLHRVRHLPDPQRRAIDTAFGLSAGDTPDRFLVGLAVLSLLSAVAEDCPLVCMIDDVQWIDRASAQILAFVARRLLAESIALVFTIREPSDEQDFAGLPQMILGGLADADARALLQSAIPGRLDERVRDRIVAETHGNPLALLELPRGLTVSEMAGGFALPDARPLERRIEQSFLRRFRTLPIDTQRLLLLAATDPVGDVSLLWRAAALLGIGTDAAAPAASVDLIELRTQVRFRHPLVRSAIYRAAALPDRRAAHRALAEAIDPQGDPARRAWHRAQAAIGPDEAIALELEHSADRAQKRGGSAAAAAFLERATALTPDPAQRGARALAAASAKVEAGAPDAATELLAAAEIGPLNRFQRAQLALLRARIVFARRRGSDAPPLLLDAAKQLEESNSGLARGAYVEAMGAAVFAGRLGGQCSVQEIAAAAARAGTANPQQTQPTDLLLDGLATRFTDGYAASVEALTRALHAFRQQTRLRSEADIVGVLWLVCPVAPEPLGPELWDDETWYELAANSVKLARDAGALSVLPIALAYLAGLHVHAGDFGAAAALIEESDAITKATGNAPLKYSSLLLAAWRGDERHAMTLIESVVRDATARGEGRVIGLAGHVTAVLYNGLGRYDAALAGAQSACKYEDLGFFGWYLVELIEAASRSGAHEVAADALRKLDERTRAVGTDWALGMLARSSALLSDGETADARYRDAIERLERSRIAVHLARAHLVYGEWLRRAGRRVDAREQLRIAYEMFSRFGADAFTERARRELVATGETVRKRATETRDVLTAQEAQVARLAAQGHTNPEIGSQLFISPRTAEYHLHKVFTKLGISSRRGLRDAFHGATQMTAPD
jgi:DNA-binding CsgD family transcriptional regulator